MKGLLVVNLGTPQSPRRADVARYLREFLSDPLVIDLPRVLWLPLLYGVIVPLRAGRSAEAYEKVWTGQGSPLLVNSQAVAEELDKQLGGEMQVRLAMRYGQPSIEQVVGEMRSDGVDEWVVLPLYPQYSDTTTGTVVAEVERVLGRKAGEPGLRIVRDYHDQPAWVAAVAGSISAYQAVHGKPERLLFSLHGIPERYVRQGDPYQQQVERSISLIAAAAGLQDQEWLLTYQSRVGREPWLSPYTDKVLEELGQSGVRKVQVVCPGFSCDCLETLEEIAMQNAELFEDHGGEQLDYIPALNASPGHVQALADIVRGD